MERIQRGFRLAGESWRVLQSDRELVVLPFVGGLLSVVVGAGLFLGVFHRWPDHHDLQFPGNLLRFFPILIVASIPATFANAAVVAGAAQGLHGEDPTLGSSLAVAWAHRWRLVRWTVLGGVVGMVLQAVAERFKLAGVLARLTVGLTWQLAVTFVVPVILFEDEAVIPAVRRSAGLFRERWGESVGGAGAIGIATMVVMLPVMVVVGVASAFLGLTAFIVAMVVVVAVFMAFTGALNGVFNAALYEYAVTGGVTGPFAVEDVQGSFRPKRSFFRG